VTRACAWFKDVALRLRQPNRATHPTLPSCDTAGAVRNSTSLGVRPAMQ
jgi:hypothetical protein